jgi:hypothetical protein
MIDLDKKKVNENGLLVHKGRYVNTTFLLETGDASWLITIADGRIAEMVAGPFVMPRWTFALRAPSEAWEKFWSADPIPGYTDLFALLKLRLLKAEGDLHPFFANLLYFKAVIRELGARA